MHLHPMETVVEVHTGPHLIRAEWSMKQEKRFQNFSEAATLQK